MEIPIAKKETQDLSIDLEIGGRLKTNIKDIMLNLIYPPVCGFCNEINNEFLCDSCRKKIEMIKVSKVDNYVNAPVYFDEHFYMFKYGKDVRDAILKYKFDEKSYMYKSFAKLLSEDEVFKNNFINNYDFIICVPIHKKRFKERGYNQSELISKEIAKLCNKTYCKDVVQKSKNIVAQSSLDKLDRVRNIKDAFKLGKNCEIVKKKKIAIFDDVFTTGATVNECAKVLKESGAEKVGVFTLAKS